MIKAIIIKPLSLILSCTLLAIPAQAKLDALSASLRESVTLDAIRAHQRALQDIATRNGGNRSVGTLGFTGSVAYVREQLQNAGYTVQLQEFPIFLSEDKTPPSLLKIGPVPRTFVVHTDFASMSSAASVELSRDIEAIDLKIPSPAPNTSSSGCEASDFAHFKAGNIALIQRGSCTFRVKIENAIAAGASGIIIFNEGNPSRTEVIDSRLPGLPANIAVLGASFFVGEELRKGVLSGPTGVQAHMKVDVEIQRHLVHNIIAETQAGNEQRVLAVGAHLDSVRSGPGMNDNGSGSATILEIALQFAKLQLSPRNKVRFMWFAGEELGLLGSDFYVSSLSRQEQAKILSMLNFDMLGSSNYARFVYDGDNSSKTSTIAQSGPQGSAFLEHVFLNYFSSQSMASHPTAFDGRSDYGPFIEVGIPAGGLFSGAEGRKSRQMAEIYGGTPAAAFDPCYHQSCDDFAHTGGNGQTPLALKSLDELSDAAAHAVFFVANSDAAIRPPQSATPELPKPDFEYRGPLLIK